MIRFCFTYESGFENGVPIFFSNFTRTLHINDVVCWITKAIATAAVFSGEP